MEPRDCLVPRRSVLGRRLLGTVGSRYPCRSGVLWIDHRLPKPDHLSILCSGTAKPRGELLENYGLQQTQCGPADLVVIWGPNNSVICTYPNNLVAPGNYQLD